MKNICFIPLRKGSKGIPGKNIRQFGGKILFCWCLDTLLESRLGDEVWIATDSDEIEAIVRDRYHQVFVYRRSSESARDEAQTIEVVLEFLSSHPYEQEDRFILLQATSPLTSIEDLILLANKMDSNLYDSLISCVRMKRFRWTEDGRSLDYELNHKPRRQEYSGFLVESGSFYYSKIGYILSSRQISSGRIGVVEVGGQAIIDIDEPIDWAIGEAYVAFQDNLVKT